MICPVLQIFVCEVELGQILHDLALRRGLVACVEQNRRYELLDPVERYSEFLQQMGRTKRIFSQKARYNP